MHRLNPHDIHGTNVSNIISSMSAGFHPRVGILFKIFRTHTQLEQKHEELQIEAAGLAKRREELEELATEQYPRAVNARSLFAHISKITWSDEGRGGHKSNSASLGHPGTVEGTICNPEKGDIRKFCLSVAEDGGVFGVTNRLGELMDA